VTRRLYARSLPNTFLIAFTQSSVTSRSSLPLPTTHNFNLVKIVVLAIVALCASLVSTHAVLTIGVSKLGIGLYRQSKAPTASSFLLPQRVIVFLEVSDYFPKPHRLSYVVTHTCTSHSFRPHSSPSYRLC
jgi:hypothetical protein